jgi:exopolysaccharide biosynthesis operon protein EpsL
MLRSSVKQHDAIALSAPRPGSRAPTALRLMAALVAGLAGASAQAELNDNIHPFAAVSYNHENNLLRASDEQRALEPTSDDFRTLTGGLIGEGQLGRQLFEVQAKVSRVTFDRFSQLDYNGKDASAVWTWLLGNHLNGHIGATYNQTLGSFLDFHEAERNLRVRRRVYADGTWRFHPSWQVRGGLAREKSSYDLAQQNFNSSEQDSVMVGVDYLPTTASTVGVQLRHLKSGYPNGERVGSALIDNGYQQDEAKLNINWRHSAVTQVGFLGGWVRRQHNVQRERDDSGFNARLVGEWAVRERLRLTGALWREYTAAEGSLINSALMTGESVSGIWDVTSKIALDAMVKHEKRDFSPFSSVVGVLPDLPSSAYTDTIGTASAGVTYRPLPRISLNLNVFREKRDGSVAAGSNSYRANGVSFSASGQF